MIGDHPRRVPVGFKPYIYFLNGKWFAASNWFFCDVKTSKARDFVNRLNGVAK